MVILRNFSILKNAAILLIFGACRQTTQVSKFRTCQIGGIKIWSNDTSGTVRDLGLSGERYVGVMTIRGNKTSGFRNVG